MNAQVLTWPRGIILFFIGLAGINALVVYLALSSSRGLIEPQPYKRGAEYQATIDELSYLAKLGVQAELSVEKSANGGQLIIFRLRDEVGQPLSVDSATLSAIRPADLSLDLDSPLSPSAAGVYSANTALASGLWRLEVKGGINGQIFRYRSERMLN
jgi:nitrogen fixation protein FixH